jgi:type IV pilus assembly protein PilW
MNRISTRQRGMSLIEIMVGVLIGLIGCVVIFQMYGTAEARKRSVASGSDMDISGRLGLMTLERDIQLAGYGFGTGASSTAGVGGVLGCTVNAFDNQRAVGLQDFSFPLAPVLIQDGAAGAPDTIITLRGNSGFVVAPKIVDASTADTKKLKADTGGRAGVLRGDVVVAVTYNPGLACAMYEITGDTNADQLTFDHATGNYVTAAGVNKAARHNKAGGVAFALAGEGSLFNLGNNPVRNIWTIADNKLAVANDLMGGTTMEAADLIVDLQAEYGIDGANGGVIDGMITEDEWTNTQPADPTQWAQLLAVRFALLARSTQYETTKVTTDNPRWSGGDCGNRPCDFVMRDLNGAADSNPGGTTGDVNNWRNYRYNVFESVVPVRNTIIGSKF